MTFPAVGVVAVAEGTFSVVGVVAVAEGTFSVVGVVAEVTDDTSPVVPVHV